MRVKTTIPKEQIACIPQFNGDAFDVFKYYCPVCLRYFNHMLVSSCCNNYICRLCIGQMARRAKTTPQYIIRCCHCMTDDFRLVDVDLSQPAKDYTDTPAKYRSNLKRKNRFREAQRENVSPERASPLRSTRLLKVTGVESEVRLPVLAKNMIDFA